MIKGSRGKIFYQSRIPVFRAYHVDHLPSLFKAADNLRQTFRRMLQVRVHAYNAVPAAVIQPGNHSRLVSEIP